VHERADAGAQGRVQQHLGADHVGADEVGGAVDRAVHVGLGGEVHDLVVPGHQLVDQFGVADVALDETSTCLPMSEDSIRPTPAMDESCSTMENSSSLS
jgi:hypothetical protein